MALPVLVATAVLEQAAVLCPRDDEGAVPTVRVEAQVRERGHGIAASLWLGGADGRAWFEREAGILRTFYFVELFDSAADRIDRPLCVPKVH